MARTYTHSIYTDTASTGGWGLSLSTSVTFVINSIYLTNWSTVSQKVEVILTSTNSTGLAFVPFENPIPKGDVLSLENLNLPRRGSIGEGFEIRAETANAVNFIVWGLQETT